MFPPEIVLKIVGHLHVPVTFRHYERRSSIQAWAFRLGLGGPGLEDKIQVILEVKKYDPESQNVTTAKNLRLVCSDFAYAYDPSYIHTHVGGTFMRRQYSNLLKFNNILWILPRMTEAAHHYLRGLITGKQGIGRKCDWFYKRSVYDTFPFTIAENILEKNVLLIYNNLYVNNLLAEYNKEIENKKIDSVNVWVKNILTECNKEIENKEIHSSFIFITKKRYIDFFKLYPSLMNDMDRFVSLPWKNTKIFEELMRKKEYNRKKNNYTEKKTKIKYKKEKIKKYQNYKPMKGIRR
tara:strand:- start:1504 stop:2385 length:882 start_codon:yes stop_codon:yes gene_type:complete